MPWATKFPAKNAAHLVLAAFSAYMAIAYQRFWRNGATKLFKNEF